MNTKKRGLDKGMIITLGVISLISALGILFCALFFLNIDLSTCDSGCLALSYSAISVVLWVALLFRKC